MAKVRKTGDPYAASGNQSQGMPRGWEEWSRDATDREARKLLDRMRTGGVTLPTGRNANPADCSHSMLIYYKDKATGSPRACIEFTQHLMDPATGAFAMRVGNMPRYGRFLVSDTQIDKYLKKFPDSRPAVQAAMEAYSCPEGSCLCSAKPGRPAMYRRLTDAESRKPLNLSGGRSMREAVRIKGAVLGSGFNDLASDFNIAHPLHRIRFEAERVPGIFANNPVPQKYSTDDAGIEALLGDRPTEDKRYLDGYRVTFEFAMDRPDYADEMNVVSPTYVFPPGMTDEEGQALDHQGKEQYPSIPQGMPWGTYLSTWRDDKKAVRHDMLITPDLMAACLAAAKYEVVDGKYVGVTDAPVYATEKEGAMGTADRSGIMDNDFPESRAQIQNRGRMARGRMGDLPPSGCVWTVDLMSGAAKVPNMGLNQAMHIKHAAQSHRQGMNYVAARTDMEKFRALCEKQEKTPPMGGGQPAVQQGQARAPVVPELEF